jgi:hypothetical protein
MLDETIKMLEEQLKEIEKPDSLMFSAEMDKYSQMGYEQQMDQHKKDIAEWEAKYPGNSPRPLIKTWLGELKQFLRLVLITQQGYLKRIPVFHYNQFQLFLLQSEAC